MQYVVYVEVVNVFARNDIDLFIPVFIKRIKLCELSLLNVRQILKVPEYYVWSAQFFNFPIFQFSDLNMVSLIFHHFKHQFASAMKLRLYCTERSIEFNGYLLV